MLLSTGKADGRATEPTVKKDGLSGEWVTDPCRVPAAPDKRGEGGILAFMPYDVMDL